MKEHRRQKEPVRGQEGVDGEARGRERPERGIRECTHWAVVPGQTSVFQGQMNGSDGLQNPTHAAIPVVEVIKNPTLRTGLPTLPFLAPSNGLPDA